MATNNHKNPGFMVSSVEDLQEKIRQGIASLDRGQYVEFKDEDELRGFFEQIKAGGRDHLRSFSNEKPV